MSIGLIKVRPVKSNTISTNSKNSSELSAIVFANIGSSQIQPLQFHPFLFCMTRSRIILV